jgi:small-conductance mechanosensitive channel
VGRGNYSIEDPTMLVPIYVQVSYKSGIEEAMEIMVEVARRHLRLPASRGAPQCRRHGVRGAGCFSDF